MSKQADIIELYEDSLYKKIDTNNIQIITAVQKACLEIIKICTDNIRKIRDKLKDKKEYDLADTDRIKYLRDLSDSAAMLKRATDTFKSVQPEANKDISDSILKELTEIREHIEGA